MRHLRPPSDVPNSCASRKQLTSWLDVGWPGESSRQCIVEIWQNASHNNNRECAALSILACTCGISSNPSATAKQWNRRFPLTSSPHEHDYQHFSDVCSAFKHEDDDDVSFYNSTASTWTLATPRTTWESDIHHYYPAQWFANITLKPPSETKFHQMSSACA